MLKVPYQFIIIDKLFKVVANNNQFSIKESFNNKRESSTQQTLQIYPIRIILKRSLISF